MNEWRNEKEYDDCQLGMNEQEFDRILEWYFKIKLLC